MASKLILDRADAGVDELVSSWKNGGSYRVTIDIVQDASDPKTATFSVGSIESLDAPEENETMKDDTEGKEATFGKKTVKSPSIAVAYKK